MKNLSELFDVYSKLPAFIGTSVSDVNQRGNFNQTPLHIACIRGSLVEVMLLIMNGANIDAQGEHGYTPIHEAIEQQNLVILKYLIDSGADCSIKNHNGYTALEFAEVLKVNMS